MLLELLPVVRKRNRRKEDQRSVRETLAMRKQTRQEKMRRRKSSMKLEPDMGEIL